jgi:hypothetical protein
MDRETRLRAGPHSSAVNWHPGWFLFSKHHAQLKHRVFFVRGNRESILLIDEKLVGHLRTDHGNQACEAALGTRASYKVSTGSPAGSLFRSMVPMTGSAR